MLPEDDLCHDLRPAAGRWAGGVPGAAGGAGRAARGAGAFRLSPEFLGGARGLLSARPLRRPVGAGHGRGAGADRGGLCRGGRERHASVYWFTQDFNATARRLYDRIGVATPFIRYNRRAGETGAPGPGVTIRPVAAADEAAWRELVAGLPDVLRGGAARGGDGRDLRPDHLGRSADDARAAAGGGRARGGSGALRACTGPAGRTSG